MKEAVYLMLGLSAGIIAWILAWALVSTRHFRIAMLASLREPPQKRVASLFATLWLVPVMFGLGGVRNLLLAVHLHPWPVNDLLSVIMILAAFHLARAAFLLRWVIRHEHVG